MTSKQKEGGHAWLVVFASFLVHVIVGGLAYSVGIWQMIFTSYFSATRYEVACLGVTMMSLTALAGIPSTLIIYRFGYRVCVLIGAVLSISGLTLACFATELYELYLSMAAISGLGLGLVLTPSVMVLRGFFDPVRLLFASSVAATGSSLGVVFIPILIYHLEEMYAWKGALIVLIGACANIAVCALVMHDITPCTGRRRKRLLKIFEPSLFKSVAFVGLISSNLLWSAGSSTVFFFIPEYALKTGLNKDDAVMLLGVIGVTNFVSRVVFQLFNHSAKLDATSNFLCSAGLAGIVTFLFPEFFKHKAGEIGYCIMFGLHCGYWSTFVSSVMAELISGELIAYGRGYISLSVGLGYVLGPLVSACLLDNEHDIKIIFYAAGSAMLLSSMIMLAISLKKCYYRPAFDGSATNSSNSIGSQVSTSNEIEAEPVVGAALLTTV